MIYPDGPLAERKGTSCWVDAGLKQVAFAILGLVVLGKLCPTRQRDVAVRSFIDPRNAVASVGQLIDRGLVTAALGHARTAQQDPRLPDTGSREAGRPQLPVRG